MDVNLWAEVERMAVSASSLDAQQAFEFPTEDQIKRWEKLFGYSRHEAINLIQAQREDIVRDRISDEHWEMIRANREAEGHDRETYSHLHSLQDVKKLQSATIECVNKDGEVVIMVLFRLGGLLSTPEKVQNIAGLDEVPDVRKGQGSMGAVDFCIVDQESNKRINAWLAQQVIAKAGD